METNMYFHRISAVNCNKSQSIRINSYILFMVYPLAMSQCHAPADPRAGERRYTRLGGCDPDA
jgi:hypothetical protein